MTEVRTKAIEIFYSYAHKDERLRNELDKHLFNMKKQGLITSWYDRDISAGTEWEHEIDMRLNSAQIILLLISPDFLASEYCYSIEMTRALERHETGEARVIPILMQPVDWQGAPFKKLQVLPKSAKPVTRWKNRAEAFLDITKGIREAVKDLAKPPAIFTDAATRLLSSSQDSGNGTPAPDPVWNVPFRRNPFFTGRDEIIALLRTKLSASKTPLPLIIRGLGGVGKTQTASEYAYRYRNDYQHVLWVRADTADLVVADFVDIATSLNLPIKNEKDQRLVVTIVKRWFQTHHNWLLIFDNADNLEMVRDFLPIGEQGHILLTTRTPATGTEVQEVELESMSPGESALFLLRRAKRIELDTALEAAPELDQDKAQEISALLGGLPLAIAQAGAYIERTKCGLSGYLEHYEKRRNAFLQDRNGLPLDYDKSVATTWSLSFEKIEETSTAAADLLRLCAFLQPDAIPEELIRDGASELGSAFQSIATDLLEWDETIEELLRYSLVRRNPDDATLTIHRLVQAVLRDGMNPDTQREWAERVVRLVNRAFPEVKFENWPRCQRYLPHAQVCMTLVEEWNLEFEEVARLLDLAGDFLRERAHYTEAEPLLIKALSLREKLLGSENLAYAESLYHVARLYYDQGKYTKAESLYLQALSIREKVLGPGHPDVATTLNYLGLVYLAQRRHVEAKSLHQRALSIREQVLCPDHPDVAYSLFNLAGISVGQEDHKQTEALQQRGIEIFEKTLSPEHPDILHGIYLLALDYIRQEKYEQALPLLERALTNSEKVLGHEHPQTALFLRGFGFFYYQQSLYDQAEVFELRALAIREKILGYEHPYTGYGLRDLAITYIAQGKYETAKPLLRRSLAIFEKTFGFDNLIVADLLVVYASTLRVTKQKKEAVQLETRAKLIRDKHTQENEIESNHEEKARLIYNANDFFLS
jgi:tetratricopeptide (TPR) repeat protein